MDKFQFALGCIACVSAIEGAAIVCGEDGVILAAMTGIIGMVAGAVLGVQYTTNKLCPPTQNTEGEVGKDGV